MNAITTLLFLTGLVAAPSVDVNPESGTQTTTTTNLLTASGSEKNADGGSTDQSRPRHPEAIQVYACDFEDDSDVDYDLWPDHWTRRRGRGFPAYLKLEIVDNPREVRKPGKRCLQGSLDGGAIAAFSPHVPIGSEFSYLLEGHIRTEGLKNNSAYYSITFCDKARKALETIQSDHVRATTDWQQIRIGPITPSHRTAEYAQISLHVEPDGETDITGIVQFDDIWFGRFPRVVLEANNENHIYTDGKKVVVTCRATGMSDPNSLIDFELLDIRGKTLARTQSKLKQDSSTVIRLSESPGLRPAPKNPDNVFSGQVEWSPPIGDYGFYRVRISMLGRSGLAIERSINVVVLSPLTPRENGVFGWSLPNGENPIPMRSLAPLLGQCGINWLKFPVWYGTQAADREQADRVSTLIERLDSYGIQMVGMLDQPPSDIRQLFEDKGQLPVASIFVDKEMWKSAIAPVMMRRSLKIRWWQLGSDLDTSFVEFPSLDSRVREIRQHISRFGQDVGIGFPWQASNVLPSSRQAAWGFLSIVTDPPFTGQETLDYFQETQSNGAQCWLMLQPISRQHYHLESRILDLTSRMILGKAAGAKAIFATNPFDRDTGLMESNGQPGELFIPWRTTAKVLTEAIYIGRITLPSGSYNAVFARGNDAIMAVWNDQPTRERLYLGQNVEVIDAWGHTRKIANHTHNGRQVQEIEVGQLPIFVTGLNLPVARWRIDFGLQNNPLGSFLGKEQFLSYHMKNTFPQSASGEIALVVPENWDITPRRQNFELSPGQEQSESVSVILKSDSSSGLYPISADVHVTADQDYFFEVFGAIRVGQDDVVIELSTRLDEAGNIILDQHVINRNDRPITFNCFLFVPDRRRLRRQVYTPAQGRTSVSYILPHATGLVGKSLWLRAEETSGTRVLNYHVIAEP